MLEASNAANPPEFTWTTASELIARTFGWTLLPDYATLTAAYAALPLTGGTMYVPEDWEEYLGNAAIAFQITPGKPLCLKGAYSTLSGLTYSGTGTGIAIQVGDGRTVTDGVLNSTTTIKSATAAFTPADTRKAVFGAGIPADTTTTYVNATTATLSAAANGHGQRRHPHDRDTLRGLGSIEALQIRLTAFGAQTGVKLTQAAHRGYIQDVRVLGNSYSVGSRGIWGIASFVNYIDRRAPGAVTGPQHPCLVAAGPHA